ncbi:MAG TPA: peptidylprolyl isomerase, partial [Arenibaculum sp.]|nr:peptidylprolyl isomerase [Arenibaculum sp.]
GFVLANLRPGIPAGAAADQGDRFMMGESYGGQSSQDVEALFGRPLARALLEIEPGRWHGPVASGHGLHLVRVEARSGARLPALAEVRDRVRRDWTYEQRQAANQAVFEQLLARYELAIEAGGLGRSVSATPGVEAERRP